MKVIANDRPKEIEVLGKKKLANFNIREVTKENEDGTTYTMYEYEQLKFKLTDTPKYIEDTVLEAQRKQAMLDGATYNDYQISLTKDDGDGLVQVKSGFELGLTSTTIHFENGTKMPITVEEFPAFASWFVNERNKFFGGINE